MNNWAVVKLAKVINMVVADMSPPVGPGCVAINVDNLSICPSIGWIYLDGLFSAPPPPSVDIRAHIAGKVRAAKAFADEITTEYAVDNTLSGKTSAEIRQIVTRLSIVLQLIQTGSLKTALIELDSVPIDNVITQSDIDKFKSRLKTYLGIVT
jgi:hypothetical protein